MMRDLDGLREVFIGLREKGYWSRVDQPDGWAAVPEDIVRRAGKVAFWHEADTRRAFDSRGELQQPLRVQHFAKDAWEIARELRAAGFDARLRGAVGEQEVYVYGILERPDALPVTALDAVALTVRE